MEHTIVFKEIYQCDKWNKDVRTLEEYDVQNIGKKVNLSHLFSKMLSENGFQLCSECRIVWTDRTICIDCDRDKLRY